MVTVRSASLAIQRAAAELDYATNLNMAHPAAFEFANRLADLIGLVAKSL